MIGINDEAGGNPPSQMAQDSSHPHKPMPLNVHIVSHHMVR